MRSYAILTALGGEDPEGFGGRFVSWLERAQRRGHFLKETTVVRIPGKSASTITGSATKMVAELSRHTGHVEVRQGPEDEPGIQVFAKRFPTEHGGAPTPSSATGIRFALTIATAADLVSDPIEMFASALEVVLGSIGYVEADGRIETRNDAGPGITFHSEMVVQRASQVTRAYSRRNCRIPAILFSGYDLLLGHDVVDRLSCERRAKFKMFGEIAFVSAATVDEGLVDDLQHLADNPELRDEICAKDPRHG